MLGRQRSERRSCLSKELKNEKEFTTQKEKKKENAPERIEGTHKVLEVREAWLIYNSSSGAGARKERWIGKGRRG